MGRYNTDEVNLVDEIARLRKRVEALESGSRAGSTSVDNGSFTVKNGLFRVQNPNNGNFVIYMGNVTNVGGGDWASQGWIYKRGNGTTAFALYGPDDESQYWALYDEAGNIIVSEDAGAGQGLARPWLPLQFVDSTSVSAPTATTTSASYVALQTTRYRRQHPKIRAYILVRASDGTTTGEVRVGLGGSPDVQIGANIIVTAGMYSGAVIEGDVPGTWDQEVELEIQAKRTAGAGTIGVRCMGAWGRQS